MELTPDFNRIITTLEHKEADRVPMAEAAISYEIMSQFLRKRVVDSDIAAQVEFWTKAGYDYVALTVGMMQPGKVTGDSAISKMIKSVILRDTADHATDESWNLERKAFIHDDNDFDTFPWEEAARLDYRIFHDVQEYLPEGMKIIALSGKIFTLTWMLMGFENFCLNLALKPQLVEKVLERVANIQYEALRAIIKIPNVAAVWAVDDLAFGTGTMINPAALRQYVFPWYKKFGQMCHDNNMYFFFHSDGLLWDVLEDLIAIGVDALHPIDPTCLNIEEVKRKVAGRLTIIGNVSNEILMNGTPEEVVELTKKRLQVLAPGGGYMIGSGNSVPEWAKIENYKAMIDTVQLFGRYPIRK